MEMMMEEQPNDGKAAGTVTTKKVNNYIIITSSLCMQEEVLRLLGVPVPPMMGMVEVTMESKLNDHHSMIRKLQAVTPRDNYIVIIVAH